AALPLHGNAPGTTGVPVQALAHVRFADATGAHFLAGAGLGLTDGIGVPGFRAFVGGGFGNVGAPRDRDGDGIVDALDACPDGPETLNGFEDADGCPDERPRLSVQASLEGRRVEGAEMHLEGAMERTWTSGPEPLVIDVDPASVWKVRAELPPCLAGEAIVTVGDYDATLDVPLERRTIGEIQIFVVDDQGEPTAGLVLEGSSDAPYCAPAEVTLDDEGAATFRVGPGTHTFRGSRDGLQGEASWTAEDGVSQPLYIILKKAK
ncbi:MAG: hypothetical protein KC656_13900, partial [Myxococcales bacterium]|nr:hypothetical protein [Myxococcales bacterium]